MTVTIERGLWLVALTVLGGVLSLHLGQDANWDLKNYHIYNPWAFLANRGTTDLHAAGQNSYFSPYLDVPYWLLSDQYFPTQPRLVGFIMGMPFGILLFLIWLLAIEITSHLGLTTSQRYVLGALAAAVGGSGATTFSEVGTTFNDIPISILIVGALTIICRCQNQGGLGAGDHGQLKGLLFISGGLVGLAAALKLTASIYAPGLAIAAAMSSEQVHKRAGYLVVFCFGWAVVFACVWGPWAWHIFSMTGSPAFPLFNSIFRSDWAPIASGVEQRFLPKSIGQAIFYPFYWIDNREMMVMEPRFADPRFAIAFIAVTVLVITAALVYKRQNSAGAFGVRSSHKARKSFVMFFVISYIIWEYLFSYLRYGIALECLIGLIILIALVEVLGKLTQQSHFYAFLAVLLFTLCICVSFTNYPAYGRRPFGDKVFDVHAPALRSNALVVLLRSPLAYVAPFFARKNKDVEFVGIHFDGYSVAGHELGRRISEKISRWTGPIYLVARSETIGSDVLLTQYGLYPAGPCETFFSSLDPPLWLCPLQKSSAGFKWPSALEDRAYLISSNISLVAGGAGVRYVSDGWADPEPWGRWMAGPSSSLELDLGTIPVGDLIFDIKGQPFLTPRHSQVVMRVMVNGFVVMTKDLDYKVDETIRNWRIRIPSSVAKVNGAHLSIEFQFDKLMSPAALHMSADERSLTFAASEFSVYSAGIAADERQTGDHR